MSYTNKKLRRAILGLLVATVVAVAPVAASGTASAVTRPKSAASHSASGLTSGTYQVLTVWGSDKWTGQWILKVSAGQVTGLAWFVGPGGPYLAPFPITGTTGDGGINLNRSECAVDSLQTSCFHQAYRGTIAGASANGYWAQIPSTPDLPSQTFTMTFVSSSTTNWCWPQPVPLYCAATPVPPDTPPSTLTLSSGTYEVVSHWSSDTWTGHWVFSVTGGKISGLAYLAIRGSVSVLLARFRIARISNDAEELRIEYQPSVKKDFAVELAQSRNANGHIAPRSSGRIVTICNCCSTKNPPRNSAARARTHAGHRAENGAGGISRRPPRLAADSAD